MSSIPQGAFASRKVRQNIDQLSLRSKVENKGEGKKYFYLKSQEGGIYSIFV